MKYPTTTGHIKVNSEEELFTSAWVGEKVTVNGQAGIVTGVEYVNADVGFNYPKLGILQIETDNGMITALPEETK